MTLDSAIHLRVWRCRSWPSARMPACKYGDGPVAPTTTIADLGRPPPAQSVSTSHRSRPPGKLPATRRRARTPDPRCAEADLGRQDGGSVTLHVGGRLDVAWRGSGLASRSAPRSAARRRPRSVGRRNELSAGNGMRDITEEFPGRVAAGHASRPRPRGEDHARHQSKRSLGTVTVV